MGILTQIVLWILLVAVLSLPSIALWEWIGGPEHALFWGMFSSGAVSGYVARRIYWRHERKLSALRRRETWR